MESGNGGSLPVSRSRVQRAGTIVRDCQRRGVDIPDPVIETIDAVRAWHLPTLRFVQGRLEEAFHRDAGIGPESLPITSRLKTQTAVLAKLRRSETSLARMQDVSGARIVVAGLTVQDAAATLVKTLFRGDVVREKDQRVEADRYGYRAIHVVVSHHRRLAEIQIRTAWQDV